jgi:phage protein D
MVLQQAVDYCVGGDGSALGVRGADRSSLLNREQRCRVWSDVTDSSLVQQICSGHGLIPRCEATSCVHAETGHSLVQRESDLELIYRLARRNGYWFWLSYDSSGQAVTAHFQKPPQGERPSLTLSLRAGAANLEGLSLLWDVDRPTAVSARQLDLASLSPNDASIDRSPLTCMARHSLADLVSEPRIRQLAVPVSDQADLQSRAEALLMESGWFVTARAMARLALLSRESRAVARLSRLRRVVRPNSVVTLEGVGSRHAGSYLVARVQHRIDSDDHLMTLDLIRNGWY